VQEEEQLDAGIEGHHKYYSKHRKDPQDGYYSGKHHYGKHHSGGGGGGQSGPVEFDNPPCIRSLTDYAEAFNQGDVAR
jgi:hypothetical protein